MLADERKKQCGIEGLLILMRTMRNTFYALHQCESRQILTIYELQGYEPFQINVMC